MRLPVPYKQFDKLVEQETFESTFTWGLRMAVSATAPVIWGLMTGRMADATWIALAAEGICFVELKGSFTQGVRVLIAGAILAVLFTLFGAITSFNVLVTTGAMLIVGFISGLFKNLGDRGSNLAVSVFVVFIISNAFPAHSWADLYERLLLVSAGGLWSLLVGAFVMLLMPVREPYRRTVALIWRSMAELTAEVAKGWDGKTLRSSLRDIYVREKNVRNAIDNSFHFYESMAHQVTEDNKDEYQLAQVRKATAIAAANIIAVAEELETVNIRETDATLRLKLHDVLKALQQVVERMAVFIVTLKPEDELLLISRINLLKKLLPLLKDYLPQDEQSASQSIKRVIQVTERSMKLIESIMTRLSEIGEDLPVFRSYSLFKTLFILHPGHWFKNVRLLFNFDTFTTRYALRTAIAAAVAIFISKWYNIDHGYWIPFTVIIISQPYFGATFKKAIDRVLGTVLGGLAGGILLRLHLGIIPEVLVLFLSFVMMVYYLRKRYSVAAFFITISLIMLFNIEMPISPNLIYVRAFSTMGGAALAIISGFVLLPTWDKQWLPVHLAKAIRFNYEYFLRTFFSDAPTEWTRFKRSAESNNSNVFDSFTRYIEEPRSKGRIYVLYYRLITHNVRITRELNNIHMERENALPEMNKAFGDKRPELCLQLFRENMRLVRQIAPDESAHHEPPLQPQAQALTQEQLLYLDRLMVELKAMHADLDLLVARLQAEEKS